jgi:hypothetical protein
MTCGLSNPKDGMQRIFANLYRFDSKFERFGCELCYHEAERKMVRTKTKCPGMKACDRQIISTHPFPEIAVEPTTGVERGIPELIVHGEHPNTGGLADRTHFPVTVFEHKDHRHLSYEGGTFDPVLVAGSVHHVWSPFKWDHLSAHG